MMNERMEMKSSSSSSPDNYISVAALRDADCVMLNGCMHLRANGRALARAESRASDKHGARIAEL